MLPLLDYYLKEISKITLISGAPASGKTLIALNIVRNEDVLYIDLDKSLNDFYISDEFDNFYRSDEFDESYNRMTIYSSNLNAEKLLEEIQEFSLDYRYIVIDSIEKLFSDINSLKNLIYRLGKIAYINECKFILTTQIKFNNIALYNSIDTVTDTLIFLEESSPIYIEEEIRGNKINVNILKHRYCIAPTNFSIDLIYGRGVDIEEQYIEIASDIGIIIKKKGWYEFKGNMYRKNEIKLKVGEIYEAISKY